MTLRVVEGDGAPRFANPYFDMLLTQPLACSACRSRDVSLTPAADPDEAMLECRACGSRKVWHAPSYAREPGRLPDGRVAEVAPYFVAALGRGTLVCGACGSRELDLRTTLVPEAVLGDCRSCGDTRSYSCPPGMANVVPRGAARAVGRPRGRPSEGDVIQFKPRGV